MCIGIGDNKEAGCTACTNDILLETLEGFNIGTCSLGNHKSDSLKLTLSKIQS